MIKDTIRNQLWDIYDAKGYKTLEEAAWKLMKLCESKAKDQKYRELKGEIAEVVLECLLCEIQRDLQPSIVLKGLCIPFRNSNSTTELDLTLVTPKRIILFESKSYMHRPKVTEQCKLGDKMDVAAQSKLHLTALNQYIGGVRNKDARQTPYKFILFEMSTEGVNDQRTEENKKRIPVANPATLRPVITQVMVESSDEVWDMNTLLPILTSLNANSDKQFERHMKRMMAKKTKKGE